MENQMSKIREMYESGKTGEEIAKELGYSSPQTIYNKLEKMGIKRRKGGEAQKTIEIAKDELEELYEKGLSLRLISEKFGCGEETVHRLMIKYGIKRKDRTWKCAGWNKGKTKETSNLVRKMAEKVSRTRKRMYKTGELQHWNTGKSWNNEVRKKISRSLKGKLVGCKNPNWKGRAGTEAARKRRSLIGSREYEEWRKEVFERDGYSCQFCGKKSEGDIQAHHIVPFAKDFSKALDPKNGVTLCENCHKKIKGNESEYKLLFNQMKKNA